MLSNFKPSLNKLIDSERGFQADPDDKGNKLPDGRAGCTNLGVTQFAWESYVGHPVTWADMKALTPDTVAPFYKRKYWDMVHGDDLPTGLDYLLFDFAVNAGPGTAVKLLQKIIGVVQDGAIGPITLSAIRVIPPKQLIERFSDAKEAYYKSLKDKKFEDGWINRIHIVELNALRMVV